LATPVLKVYVDSTSSGVSRRNALVGTIQCKYPFMVQMLQLHTSTALGAPSASKRTAPQ
jgi:hypothetical protein